MDKKREDELKEFMESEIGNQNFFDYPQWDGFIEDEDDPMTSEELDHMAANFQVVITIVPK